MEIFDFENYVYMQVMAHVVYLQFKILSLQCMY